MDNVTHALAGMLVAEAVLQHRGGDEAVPARWGFWAYAVSALANNVPDVDLVYTGITAGKLGYLLHHRGHTHTLVGALPLAVLVWMGARLLGRRRHPEWTSADWRWLAGLAGSGALLHLAMDGTNNYGVHPFWPLDGRWFYGDTIFIVEPLLWASVAPALAFASRRWWARATFALIGAAGVALSWLTGFVPAPLAAVVTLWTAGVAVAAWRLEPRRRLAVSVGATMLVYALFSSAGARARQIVAAAPGGELVDAALSPLPGNPACWAVASLRVDGDELVLRRGAVAPFSFAPPARVCPERLDEPTAPLTRVDRTSPDGRVVRWEGRAPRGTLAELAADCRGAAFLRWGRIPFRGEHEGRPIVGDLRYDMESEPGWAEVELEGPCPARVPGWVPPRQDLMR